ncbi:MAG: hypothetical protein AAFV88_22205 [Planctomycetota bacterium]
MNASPSKKPGKRVGKKSAGSIAVVILLSLYAFLQPRLNDRFGWNLPGLNRSGSQAQTRSADSADQVRSEPTDDRGSMERAPVDAKRTGEADKPAPPQSATERDQDSTSKKANNRSTDFIRGPPPKDSKPKLKYGLLVDTGSDRFLSPEGLLYGPGSQEGHRLEHLRRHVSDMPSRSGKHGVFDGGMEGALETIDTAYARAKKNQRTTKQVGGNRTVYTVDMGRRIGYVGGRDGNRKRKPMARRVRLVLEGKKVITAFPL